MISYDLNMEFVPEIASLFDDDAYNLKQLRYLIERDDYGFDINDVNFRRSKKEGVELSEVRQYFESAFKRVQTSAHTSYTTTMCCERFEYSKKELSQIFSAILSVIKLVNDHDLQIHLEPGKTYRCLRDIGNHRTDEEVSVIYHGRYEAIKPAYDIGFHVTCEPRSLNITGLEKIRSVAQSLASYFIPIRTFDLENTRKRLRKDRT